MIHAILYAVVAQVFACPQGLKFFSIKIKFDIPSNKPFAVLFFFPQVAMEPNLNLVWIATSVFLWMSL